MLFNGGVKIGPDAGRIMLKLKAGVSSDLVDNFASHKHDHRLLNVAYHLAKEKPDTRVVLLTKDVNLRMKAKAVGLPAQDYTSDHVRDINTSVCRETAGRKRAFPTSSIKCIRIPVMLI
ncbi:MAG: PIN domain-containing protein [Desulfobacterales bacterium]